MGIAYKIKCTVPDSQQIESMFRRLPSPIDEATMTEIYNYAIEADGFYFIDNLVDKRTATFALRIFIDAALSANDSIEISEA